MRFVLAIVLLALLAYNDGALFKALHSFLINVLGG